MKNHFVYCLFFLRFLYFDSCTNKNLLTAKLMKNLTLLLFFFSFFVFQHLNATDREWSNTGADGGSIHSLGNGKMLIYEQGPDILKIYSSPYTSPSLYTLKLNSEDQISVFSTRETGTAVWNHEVKKNGKSQGQMIDFVEAEKPVMVRHLNLRSALRFSLDIAEDIWILNQKENKKQEKSLLLCANPGTNIYQKYVFPRPLYHELYLEGKAYFEPDEKNPNRVWLVCPPGESTVFICGGPELPEVYKNRDLSLNTGWSEMRESTRKWWKEFSGKRHDFEKQLGKDVPMREQLLKVIDEVSVMIRTQQAEEGAVMAGYPYPLGYVRDQYGVSRGYLALGFFDEAKRILEFYFETWRKAGKLHCAQGIGVDGIFHIHENDEVESPGYLILQAFDLLSKSGDEKFMEKLFPMLEWCWEVQKKHLAGNMLPFNGDETYVAGGILPRSTLNDGSAEATLLFIEGGERLMNWISQKALWAPERIESEKKLIQEVRKDFRKNFWRDKQLITNNPDRLNYTDAPMFRHGVCERGGEFCLVYGKVGFGGIDWTIKDENGRYQCANCIAEGSLPAAEKTVYKLLSVSLTPLYFGSKLVSPEEVRPILRNIYNSYRQTGVLSSRTEHVSQDNNRSVGYDYGFVLYNMVEAKMQGSREIFEKTLSIADETGAWSEYYLGDLPSGTRCRPWESAINLEALLRYAMEK